MSRHLNWELQTEDKLCTESDETKAKSNANCSKHSAEPRFISVFMFHGHAFRCMNAPAPLPVSFFYNPFNSILNPMTLLSQLLQVLWETLRSNNSLFYQCITWYELCLFHWQWHFFSGRPFFSQRNVRLDCFLLMSKCLQWKIKKAYLFQFANSLCKFISYWKYFRNSQLSVTRTHACPSTR